MDMQRGVLEQSFGCQRDWDAMDDHCVGSCVGSIAASEPAKAPRLAKSPSLAREIDFPTGVA
jgi:hypothetical protein